LQDTLYREADVLGQETLADMVTVLGELPLMHQRVPGWCYSSIRTGMSNSADSSRTWYTKRCCLTHEACLGCGSSPS